MMAKVKTKVHGIKDWGPVYFCGVPITSRVRYSSDGREITCQRCKVIRRKWLARKRK